MMRGKSLLYSEPNFYEVKFSSDVNRINNERTYTNRNMKKNWIRDWETISLIR